MEKPVIPFPPPPPQFCGGNTPKLPSKKSHSIQQKKQQPKEQELPKQTSHGELLLLPALLQPLSPQHQPPQHQPQTPQHHPPQHQPLQHQPLQHQPPQHQPPQHQPPQHHPAQHQPLQHQSPQHQPPQHQPPQHQQQQHRPPLHQPLQHQPTQHQQQHQSAHPYDSCQKIVTTRLISEVTVVAGDVSTSTSRQTSNTLTSEEGDSDVSSGGRTVTSGCDASSEGDRSLLDSGIFTVDSFVLSPEPAVHVPEEGDHPRESSPEDTLEGEHVNGVTTITILSSSFPSCGSTQVTLPSAPCETASSSFSPSSSSFSTPSSPSPSHVLHTEALLRHLASSGENSPGGKCLEPESDRGRVIKRSKRRKDGSGCKTEHTRRRSCSRPREESPAGQDAPSDGHRRRARSRKERAASSRATIVPLPSKYYPEKYRTRSKQPSSSFATSNNSYEVTQQKNKSNDLSTPLIELESPSAGASSGVPAEGEAVTHMDLSAAPISHPAQEPPICGQCLKKGAAYFSVHCDNCWFSLKRTALTPSQVFAVLRQWEARVQRNIGPLVALAVRGGCGINDRDSVTDMTLLHFAVKAGARGVGDPTVAVQVVEELLLGGADVHLRCKWTHMTALHYAAFFDVPLVMPVLLQDPDGVCINAPCMEYSSGTPLHIAAANLCLGAARLLVEAGADRGAIDGRGRIPEDCIPDSKQYTLVPDVQEIIQELHHLLHPRSNNNNVNDNDIVSYCNAKNSNDNNNVTNGISNDINSYGCVVGSSMACAGSGSGGGGAVLLAMGLRVGDRVLVNGIKTGVLRFVGCTEWSTGLWAGVELEAPEGRHNGTVRGVVYFRCAQNYGLFVPVVRLTKIPNVSRSRVKMRRRAPSQGRPSVPRDRNGPFGRVSSPCGKKPPRRSLSLPPGKVNHGKVDVSKISSRVARDINDNARRICIGDRVVVDLRVHPSIFETSASAYRKQEVNGTNPPLTLPSSSDVSPNSSNCYISSSSSLNSPSFSKLENLSRTTQVGVAAGVVKFAGTVGFASGYWVGLELDEAIGSNDGSVNGTRYFDCRAKHGVFAAPSRVAKIKEDEWDSSILSKFSFQQYFHRSSNNISSSARNLNNKNMPSVLDHTLSKTGLKNAIKKNNYSNVKPRIDNGRNCNNQCNNNTKNNSKNNNNQSTNKKKNFRGESKEKRNHHNTNLQERKSKSEYNINKKSVNEPYKRNKINDSAKVDSNVTYSSSQSKSTHCIHENKMPSKTHESRYHSNGSGLDSYPLMYGSCQSQVGCGPQHNSDRTDRALPMVLPNLSKSSLLNSGLYPTKTLMNNLNKSFSARYISSRLRQEEFIKKKEEEQQQPLWQEHVAVTPGVRYNPHHYDRDTFDGNWLELGCNVFYKGKIGILKYIGSVDFELGTWLGVELNVPCGRHDGQVLGKRYFSCKSRHGVIVKPRAVTVRGINGAVLVRDMQDKEEDEEEEEEYWV